MTSSFQVDKFHFNNLLESTALGDRYSGFSLADQSKVQCLVLNEDLLAVDQVTELQRVTHVLAQREHPNVLLPLAWGSHAGRHYIVWPEFGRVLGSYANLKPLTPPELLLILRRLLKALIFAESREITCHQSLRPDTIQISLADNQVKLAFFGYPTLNLRETLEALDGTAPYTTYLPPAQLTELTEAPQQSDLYALGLIGLQLATALPLEELFSEEQKLQAEALRARLSSFDYLPLPIQELLYKLLNPVLVERYTGFQPVLDDVVSLAGEEETGLSFQTFILDTLINGRFKLGEELARGRISRLYSALDLRDESGGRTCVVKLVDLRQRPEMMEVFHTRLKTLAGLHHEHVLDVLDVGVHFENGYLAMESGLVSLEELLIKRGTLPLTDAGRIVFQLCKALEGLHFNHIMYHGAIKPSNVFLTTDLRSVKLGDALVADFFLRHGNLNYIGAEYFNPEFIKDGECDVRSDLYALGVLLFEMMVGHPPFSFKIEDEIKHDHLYLAAATRVEPALLSHEVKDIILRLLEKNPAARYQTVAELKDDLTVLLGYDKKAQVEVPNLFFDFAELSMIGKNAREKSEETLAIRLPAVNNRARGAVALLIGHGEQLGDASRAATSALKHLRELLFNPGQIDGDFSKLQKTEPEAFLDRLLELLNQRMYREAFSQGKTKRWGVSAAIGIVQENTLFMHQLGDVHYMLLAQGGLVDVQQDKWTIADSAQLGDKEKALSADMFDRLGYGEMIEVKRIKRRLKDGDQLVLLSANLERALSVSEIKELVTSSNDPAQSIEMVRSDSIRRRLEGTISCVLLNVGNVMAYAEQTISHAKKGMLARNFLAQGDTYLNDAKVEEAIEQYTQALEINPNFAIIHHQLGVAYIRKGLSSYAQSCFERAIELNSKLGASYLEIARLLINQRRNRDVLPLLRSAVANGVKDGDVFAMLGHELIRIRSYDEAVLYLTYALDLDPGHPAAFRDRIIAVKRRGALDTKLMQMFATRPRLADDQKTVISQGPRPVEGEEE
jgi:serine/threonine protein kinase/Tfp pilus assembly protein PilF